MYKFSWQRALAVPAAVVLTLSGALLAAGPVSGAPAAPPIFTVDSPAEGSTVTTANPILTGKAPVGTEVGLTYTNAYGAKETFTQVIVSPDATGHYSLRSDFGELAPGQTTTTATLTDFGTAVGPYPGTAPLTRTIHFATPPVALPGKVAAVFPRTALVSTASSYYVRFNSSGFAPNEPVTLTATDPHGQSTSVIKKSITDSVIPETADAEGNFYAFIAFPNAVARGTYVVTATGSTSHTALSAPVTLQAVTTPTVTTPKIAQKIVGSQVTFSGTAAPHDNIFLVIATPYGLAKAELAFEAAVAKSTTQPSAFQAPLSAAPLAAASDLATPIVTSPEGNWSVTYAAKPGSYSVAAFAAPLTAKSAFQLDGAGEPLISDPSTPVTFTVAAAPVTPAAVVPSTTATAVPVASTDTLAYTGSTNAAPIAIGAGLLVLIGAGLLVGRRIRRVGAKN